MFLNGRIILGNLMTGTTDRHAFIVVTQEKCKIVQTDNSVWEECHDISVEGGLKVKIHFPRPYGCYW